MGGRIILLGSLYCWGAARISAPVIPEGEEGAGEEVIVIPGAAKVSRAVKG
jgi:hypothetical protein